MITCCTHCVPIFCSVGSKNRSQPVMSRRFIQFLVLPRLTVVFSSSSLKKTHYINKTHSVALRLCETFILSASSSSCLFTCKMLRLLRGQLRARVTFTPRFKSCHAVKLLVRLLYDSRLRLAAAIDSYRELEKTLVQLSSLNSRRFEST